MSRKPDYLKTGVKLCRDCCEAKPLDEFHRPPSWHGKCQSYCKSCALKRNKKWMEANQTRRRNYSKQRRRRVLYGLSEHDHDARLEAQGEACAVCREPLLPLQIDHCHDSGIVRGLLCGRCNRLLANARDEPWILDRAIEYLEAAKWLKEAA